MKNKQIHLIVSFLFLALPIKITAQEILKSKHYFINGEKVYAIQKSNDTLYSYKCSSGFTCSKKPRDHYKILKFKQDGNKYLLAVEKLDSIQLSTTPIREERFEYMGFEVISENEIKITNEAVSFTKDSLVKIPFDLKYFDNKLGFTYYTENYLKSFETDYVITTEMANDILKSCQQNTKVIALYKNTNAGDMYMTAISAELLTLEMIRRNLSPIHAKKKLNNALRQQ